jgi:hypothetical protein
MATPSAQRRAARPTVAPARAMRRAPVAAPQVAGYEPPQPSSSSATTVFAPVLAIGVLLLAAASISPASVPWPRVAAGLHANRSDLAILGFGAAGLALVALFLQRFGL